MEGCGSDFGGWRGVGACDAHVRLGAEHGAGVTVDGVQGGGFVAVADGHVSVGDAVVEVDVEDAGGRG